MRNKVSKFGFVENSTVGTASLVRIKLNLQLDELEGRIRCMADIGSWPCHKGDFHRDEYWGIDEDNRKLASWSMQCHQLDVLRRLI